MPFSICTISVCLHVLAVLSSLASCLPWGILPVKGWRRSMAHQLATNCLEGLTDTFMTLGHCLDG
jgi:hypothetical protein